MDVPSRPKPGPLSDRPAEESADADLPPAEAGAILEGESELKDRDPTDLNFVDPELFATQGGPVPDEDPAPAPEGDGPLEMELEDPIVDDLLTEPPPAALSAPVVPAASPLPAPPQPAPPQPAPPAASGEARSGISTRVPLAKTASLAAAASKLAAANAAAQRTTARPTAAAPSVPPAVRTSPHPASLGPDTLPKAVPQLVAQNGGSSNLASWASARSSALGAARPAPVPLPPAPQPSPATSAAATGRNPVLKAVTPPSSQPGPSSLAHASPSMDRDFIARNQVVERYLSGRLPLKGARDFELFCAEHPEILDELGLPEKVNAALRLLEASGKPEPWQERARPAWQKPEVTLAALGVALVLGLALAIVAGISATKSRHIAELQKQSTERSLDPATSTRKIRVLPDRSGASNTPAITIGGSQAELADFRIDVSHSPYHFYRVTIDRIDQGRVGVITNLAKDSNGHLRLALNSSALGPGNYQFTIEGLNSHGDPEPDSWVTIGVLH